MTHGFATDKHGRNMNHSYWARFQTALQFLRRYFAPIRLPCASSLRRGTDTQVYLKLESELPTGSPDQTLENLSNGLHGRYRGRGLVQWLMECVLAHPVLQGLRRWILVTADAHDLYRKYGFTSLA